MPVRRTFDDAHFNPGCSNTEVLFGAALAAMLPSTIDTGIAELLDPILENGWDSVVDSVKRLGTKESI